MDGRAGASIDGIEIYDNKGNKTYINAGVIEVNGLNLTKVYTYTKEYIDTDGDRHYVTLTRKGNVVTLFGMVSANDWKSNYGTFPILEGYRPKGWALCNTIHGTNVDDSRIVQINSIGQVLRDTMGNEFADIFRCWITGDKISCT